jgi:prolyl 4-hydroxylase
MTGNVREALQLTDELLELVPYHQRAMGNRKYYVDMMRERGELNARGDTGRFVKFKLITYCDGTVVRSFYCSLDLKGYQPFSTGNLRLQKPSNNLPERDVYEMLCR